MTRRLNTSSSARPLSTAQIAASIVSARVEQLGGVLAAGSRHAEIVDRAGLAAGDLGRQLGEHAEAEVLERGNRVGQRHRAAELVDLEAQLVERIVLAAIEPHVAPQRPLGIAGQPAHARNIARRFDRAVGGAVGRRERLGVACGERRGAARFLGLGERCLERIGPSAQHFLQPGVDPRFVGRAAASAEIEHVAQHREVAALDHQAPVERPGAGLLLEQFLHLQPGRGRQHVARQPDEAEQVPPQRGHDQREPRPRAIGERHHRGRDAGDVGLGEADHDVVRQHGQRMDQRLGIVSAGLEFVLGHLRAELAAQQRDLVGRGGQRGAGPDARMDRERGHPPALDQRHDEQVERDSAMHARQVIGLDDQRDLCRVALALVEPGEGVRVSLVGDQLARAPAADAERLRLGAVAFAHDLAEQGQHAVGEPAQQCAAFGVGHAPGVLVQALAHPRPVAHCGAHVSQGRRQLLFERAALPGVDALGLEVDHRFGGGARLLGFGQRGQPPGGVAARGEDRMDEQVDRQPLRGHGGGDRIDQKRHVAVDHRDLRDAAAGCRTDQHGGVVLLPLARGFEEEGGGLVELAFVGHGVAGQQRIGHSSAEDLRQLTIARAQARRFAAVSPPRRLARRRHPQLLPPASCRSLKRPGRPGRSCLALTANGRPGHPKSGCA